jgi:hypothetical protein
MAVRADRCRNARPYRRHDRAGGVVGAVHGGVLWGLAARLKERLLRPTTLEKIARTFVGWLMLVHLILPNKTSFKVKPTF